MDASAIKALSVALLVLGSFAYAGWLVYLGARLHALELRLDALEERRDALEQKITGGIDD